MSRRGEILDLAVLGLLHESGLHGYELRKRLNLMLGWGRMLSYGSLYPALKKLLRAGLIADEYADVGRRQKIVYRITDAGRDHFDRQVTESGPAAWDDDSFDIRFAFFSRTSAEVRLRILEGRRTRLQERLDRISSHTSADSHVAELRRHRIDSVERELAWLAALIERERTNPDPTGAPTGLPPGGNQS